MRTRAPGRVIGVTAGISLTGMLCGAALGVIALSLADWRLPGKTAPGDWPGLLLIGTLGGALLGAVLAPLVAWLLLRRVSLGRAIAETSLGALVGLVVGAFVHPLATVWFGLGGFVLAAARLRWMRS